jgi:hypothetical protein
MVWNIKCPDSGTGDKTGIVNSGDVLGLGFKKI